MLMKVLKHSIWGVLAACLMMAQAQAEETPKEVVESAVSQIIKVLDAREDKERLTEQDREGIQKAVEGRFDYTKMARGSLATQWKNIDEAQQAEFTNVFRQLLERSYGNKLAGYKGQKIEYGDTEMKKSGRATVLTQVVDETKSTPVEYRLYDSGKGWKVYDIKIEGVSMVGTFRKDFKSILGNDGYDGLLTQLKEKVERLKAKDAES